MLVISRANLLDLISVDDAIEAARDAFIALSTGRASVPARAHLKTTTGVVLSMPAYDGASERLGVKLVSIVPGNAQRGLPTVQAAVLLMDAESGAPIALLEGTFLTQLRTGAAIGLGAQLLAQPDAGTVALFGAGGTARASLWAVCSVRRVREVRVVHQRPDRFGEFVTAMRAFLGDRCPPLRRVDTAAEALAGADIVIAATTATTPLFPSSLVEDGAYVGGLGAHAAGQRELDTDLVARSRFIVDSRDAAMREAGEIIIPIEEGRLTAEHIAAEIGEVAAHQAPGRNSPTEVVVFKSVGLAIQDLVLAARVHARAVERGVGTPVSL